jgi:predicted acylesterase/phospholipase RssA
MAFFGVLKALHDALGWDFGRAKPKLRQLLGVSIGAFSALLLVLGFSVDELLGMVRFLDLSSMVSLNIANVLTGGPLGLDDGSTLQSKLEALFLERTGKKDMTLEQLRAHSGISLMVGVTDLQRAQFVTLSADTHASMSVCTAVRASMALPPLFAPVTAADGTVYVDGGLLDNYPMHALASENVLGLRLASSAHATVNPSSFSFLTRISNIISTPMEEAAWCCLPAALRMRTITILIKGVNAVDVSLANDLSVRVGLVALGMEAGTEAVQAWKLGHAPRGSCLVSDWIPSIPAPLRRVVQQVRDDVKL